ncbi:(Fe-S)-binding protein [Chloroflexota bacterium]
MVNKQRLEQLNRFKDDIKKCVRCGFCASFCPVFAADGSESSLTRGKNMVIKALLDGEAAFSDEMAAILNKCTLCMACTQNCPTNSPIPSLIVAARADKFSNKGIGFPYSLIYRNILPRRKLFGNTVRVASWFQWLCLPRTAGTVRHLPFFLSALGKGRHIPSIAPKFLRQTVPECNRPPPGTKTRYTVGYFTGCMTDFVFPELGTRIINFLNRHGVEVIVSREQGCCGAPVFLGAGDFETGRKMADRNVQAFIDTDYIITDCATCASAMKDYAKYLADTEKRKQDYTDFAGKIKDITEYLVDILQLPPAAYQISAEFRGKRVTYHEPCHLGRYLGVREPPRKILKALRDIDYIEMPCADRCCGMAGSFSLYYYDLSKKIAEKKIDDIRSTNADIVVTDCPGCRIQLTDNIVRHGMPQKVMHILDLLG